MKSILIMSWIFLVARTTRNAFVANAFQPVRDCRSFVSIATRMSSSDGFTTDDSGRRIRSRARSNDSSGGEAEDDWGAPAQSASRATSSGRQESWDDAGDDDWGGQSKNNDRNFGGWDDFDVESIGSGSSAPRRRSNPPPRGRGGDRGRQGNDRRGNDRRGGSNRNASDDNNDWGRNNRQPSRIPRQRTPYPKKSTDEQKQRSINMNALEAAGFVHLYGLSSILNALKAEQRDLTTSHEKSESLFFDEEQETPELSSPPPPQAQFRPYLFVQEKASSQRRGSKAVQEEQVLELAEKHGIPVARVDKGILNTLSGNRPHQGMVLRCGKLYFENMSRIPLPDNGYPDLWLVLDEVVDPQNLGALIRSAYFLGQTKLSVMVCTKNSAPPTPVVSAASAGALELSTVYSTNNLPRTLQQAADDGFRIVGASSSVPTSRGEYPQPIFDLQDLPPGAADKRPVLLVLGSEGHGLRTLVAKACTEFVRIPSGVIDDAGDDSTTVDSLNVSVTGGIILWQLLRGQVLGT